MTDYKKCDHPPITIKNKYLKEIEKYKEYKLCFNDGSKFESQFSDYAFSIDGNYQNYTTNNHSSIFTIEITAFLHSLNTIHRTNFSHKKFLIITDSLSSLSDIQNKFTKQCTIQKIHQVISDTQFSDVKIKFIYVLVK